MKIFNDKKVIALIVILVLFTICYFAIANKVSYAFVNNYDADTMYNQKLDVIEQAAISYGNENKEQIEKSQNSTMYITVQTLIDKSLIATNENGLLENPLDTSKNLNDYKIKLKIENKELQVEILKS